MANAQTIVTPVEILATIPASVAGQASIVLTVRLNPPFNLTPSHLSVSKSQAERLRDDLITLLDCGDQPIWCE